MIAARAYSRAKLGGLDGDLERSERHYREAADGFAQIDRPMMRSMCLGMVADFDERRGDYRAAINNLDEAVATNDALGLRGFNGSLLARLGWALLHDGDTARAEARVQPSAGPRPPSQQHAGRFSRPHRSGRVAPARRSQWLGGRGGYRGARAVPRRRATPAGEPRRSAS